MPTFRIKEAARLLGVSTDTLRRWADARRIDTTIDDAGRMTVDGAVLARLAQELAESADHPAAAVSVTHSTRNRFTGLGRPCHLRHGDGAGRDPGGTAQVCITAQP
jgi:excisionase family DNA binding protein